MELGCKFIFQRCDPNVFVTLALVLLYPCQLYPDGAAIFPPHDKNKTWTFSSCRKFSFIARHGWNWVHFWSCFRSPGTSTLLTPFGVVEGSVFWCAHMDFRYPIGIFCAWNIDNEHSSIFLQKKSSLASKTLSPKLCFRTRNSWLLSLSPELRLSRCS